MPMQAVMFRDLHNGLVLMHLIRHHQMPLCPNIQKEPIPTRILAVQLINAVANVDAHVVVFGKIGTHADAEAAFKGMLTAHQHDLDIVPDSLVIVIRWAVMQVQIVQPLQCVEVTAAQENDGPLLRGIGFLALFFRKEKQGLGDGGQNLLEGVFALSVKNDLGNAADLAIADAVHIGEGVSPGKAIGCVDIVSFLLLGEPCVKLFGVYMESHGFYLLSVSFSLAFV